MPTLTLEDVHALGRDGVRLYALNKDPLTAHAAELLMQATSLPLNPAQQNAALVLRKQVDAYRALYPDPLQ